METRASSHTTIIGQLLVHRGIFANGFAVVVASIFIGLLAQIAVPIGPVPITGQTLGILLVAASLGWRRGGGAIALYVAQGAAGLPVFAGGTAGIAILAGPTGGYLAGFVVAGLVVGWLCEAGLDRRFSTSIVAMLAGTACIYLLGVAWLSRFVGWSNVLPTGVLPFLVGDAIKLAIAAVALPSSWRLLGLHEIQNSRQD